MSENREKEEEHGHGHGDKPAHDKPAKATDVNSGGGHAQRGGPTFALVAAILLAAFLTLDIKSCFTTPASATQEKPISNTAAQKVLVPRFDGYTPVDLDMDWEFELETEGEPVVIKYPGVKDPIKYSGKGDMRAPSRTTGTTHITTGRPDGQEVRIRIRQVKFSRD